MKTESAEPVAACCGLCMPGIGMSDALAAFEPGALLLVPDALLFR